MFSIRNSLAFILLFIIIIGCNSYDKKEATAEDKRKELKFNQLGWSIKIPEGFEILDSSQSNAVEEKGRKAIEATYDTTIDFSATKTLFSAREGKLNYLTATITAFDPSVDGDWNETNVMVKQMLMETFASQMQDAVLLDTISSTKLIDNNLFHSFQVDVDYPQKFTLHTILYSKLHKGYDFGITVAYIDEKQGKLLKEAVDSSKFYK